MGFHFSQGVTLFPHFLLSIFKDSRLEMSDSIFLNTAFTSTSIQNKNKLITPFCTFALLHVHDFADKISRPLVISSGTNWHTFSMFRPFGSLNSSTSGHFCSSQQTQTLNCLLPLLYF